MSTIEQSSLYTDLTVEECSEINGGASYFDGPAFGAAFPLYWAGETLASGSPIIGLGRALVDTMNKTFHSNSEVVLSPLGAAVTGW